MATRRPRIVLNEKEVRKQLLKGDKLINAVKSGVGEKIAEAAQNASGDRGYEYTAEVRELETRKSIIVGSDHPRARYSEAKHGWLLEELQKNRGEL